MVTAATSAKSTPDADGAMTPAPILLSPISVAHRSQMLEAEAAGKPSTGNAIRDQNHRGYLGKQQQVEQQ
ncbi:uncharacterized protein IUM83_08724 [Phytophthora cinnamomi]|uniref:uncharacterized protein n=1 Tax=Phytophthora cinnamomi TaxID=4785 RepID=UPI00355A499E|nr:hypothetical protein IUM83_08724 [Phytophthora cinnamomi]